MSEAKVTHVAHAAFTHEAHVGEDAHAAEEAERKCPTFRVPTVYHNYFAQRTNAFKFQIEL
jgi:hypothetical protein